VNALELLERARKNQLRSHIALLRPAKDGKDGHFPLRLGITEIAGSAGCGKTQIVLGACVATASKLQSKAMYLSLGEGTSQPAIAHRLSQMAQQRIAQRCKMQNQTVNEVLNRIVTRFIRNQEEFSLFIFHELPQILEKDKQFAFVAMDSIAAMFRANDHCEVVNAAERSCILFKIAVKLKELSGTHGIPILIVNQVTADFSSNNSSSVQPALGLSWANCVNERYLLSRRESNIFTDLPSNDEDRKTHVVPSSTKFERSILCRFSPCCANIEHSFVIDDGGAKIVVPNG
jgi:DNA-repair protein XRCC3